MIAPLVPYSVRGAIWYQSEYNAGRDEQYARLLPALIRNWRRDFESPIPFYIVQLAGFMAPDAAPRLRAAPSVPSTGIAVTTNIGDEKDIRPNNKQDVGLRPALVTLSKTYGRAVESSGPTVQTVTPKGENITINFAHADGALTLKGDAARVFAVCGADRNWF